MNEKKSIAVLVLGDIGRSPRMQNHALSIAKSTPYDVQLIGYKGSEVFQNVKENKKISLHHIKNVSFTANLPFFLYLLLLPLTLVIRFVSTLHILLTLRDEIDFLIVQNPPSLPTFWIARVFRSFSNAKVIVDWHNFGFSIMALKRKNFLVEIYKYFEFSVLKDAHANLTVSKAMKNYLQKKTLKNLIVLYDQPVEMQKNDSSKNIFSQYEKVLGSEYKNSNICVSSTSWTPDENFDFLLEAIKKLDLILARDQSTKPFLFIITGKGPLRAQFEKKVREENLVRCKVICLWLESFEDYSRLLARCDAGISLHFSSSGYDLPMKILDMFGCELPVFSKNYKCIGELVQNDYNGYLFDTPKELADKLFRAFTSEEDKREQIRLNIRNQNKSLSWQKCWDEKLRPIIMKKRN